MISNKIKAVLYMKGLNLSDLAAKLNTSKQSMSNKSSRESYTAKDLVALSDLVGGDLAIIDRSTGEKMITFTPEDIKKPEK
mgnify:CR=1 FL=1